MFATKCIYFHIYTFVYDSIDRGINMVLYINVRVGDDIPIAISMIKKTTHKKQAT